MARKRSPPRTAGLAALLLAACAATSPDRADLSPSRPCPTGQEPLSSFACAATLAAEQAAVDCKLYGFTSASCGTLDVIEYGSVASTVDCYYDHGTLVAAYSNDDVTGTCASGTAHDTCTPTARTSLCP